MAIRQLPVASFPFITLVNETTTNQAAAGGTALLDQTGNLGLSPAGIASGEALGIHTLNAGVVSISPVGIVSGETLGTHSISITVPAAGFFHPVF